MKKIEKLLQRGMLRAAINALMGKISYSRELIKDQKERMVILEKRIEALEKKTNGLKGHEKELFK